MQVASILLAVGGDAGNTIPKHNVTPAEVAVLRVIHGDDAVSDINPMGNVARANREERQRLVDVYGRNDDKGRRVAQAVDALFPGVAARVFETFDELDLDPSFFKAASRVSPGGKVEAPALPPPAVPDFKTMKTEQLREFAEVNRIDLGDKTKKADIIAALEAATAQPEADSDAVSEEEDDGIGEMTDGQGDASLFK